MDNDTEEKQFHDAMLRFGKMITKGSILVEGTIASVDETAFTCTVNVSVNNFDGTSTDVNYQNVPLKVLVGSQASLIEIPSIGSDCTLCFRDNNIQRPQLSQVNQSDKILIKIGNPTDGYQTLQIDVNGFIFNGGSLNGMVKIDANVTKLSNIEKDLNNLKTIFSTTWVPVPNDGGAALKTAAATWAGQTFTPTVRADLENTLIKQ